MGGQGGDLQGARGRVSGFSYTEIEVTNLPSGAPTIKLSGELADWAHLLGALRWHLTPSDTKDTAYASVVVEGPDDYPRRPACRHGSAAAWTASAPGGPGARRTGPGPPGREAPEGSGEPAGVPR